MARTTEVGEMTTLTLREYAGQHCDVVINTRTNGTKYVTFQSMTGYGYPSLEQAELEHLLRLMRVRLDP